ncbi:MAG: beta-glucosidase, partial [Neobacillus sp.]|nr:beta-glucosidase [Neobacillus sp.]
MQKYKDNSLSLELRLEDLLSRMTLKEKVGQLNQRMFGWHAYKKVHNDYEITEAFREEVAFGDGLGALYGLFRADPWSAINYENGIPKNKRGRVANMLQRYVAENTRLGIPILFSEECPHGHMALDGTMFPTNLAIGSTWNPELYQEVYAQVAAEIRAGGGHLGLVSALDIMHDPRWGRSEECYSEDPYLASRMAFEVTKGLQGENEEDLKRPDKVAAILKHFCAQGAALGGHNGKSVVIGERELREIHL